MERGLAAPLWTLAVQSPEQMPAGADGAGVEGGSQEGMCTNTILSTDAYRIGDGVQACEVWVGVSCEHRWGN